MKKKIIRVFALTGAILLAGMYLVVLYLGLTANPNTQNVLMAAIGCTIVIPVLLYAMMLIARVLDNRLFLFLSLISFALLFLLPANIPEKSACLTGTACIYKDGNRVTCFTSHLCR